MTTFRDLTPEELKYADRDILAQRLAAIQQERAELHAKLAEVRDMAARFDTFGDSGRTRAFVGDIARIAQVAR